MFGQEYQLSGRVGASLLFTLPLALLASALIGAIYSFIVYINPFVYLNLLAFGGGLFALVILAIFAVTSGKIRNRTVAVLTASALSVSFYFTAWVVFAMSLTDLPVEEVALDPLWLFDFGAAVLESGWYEFSGQSVSGLVLGGIWLIEALGIAIAPIWSAAEYAGTHVFCETCDQWAEETEGILVFDHPDATLLEQGLRAGTLTALDAAVQVSDETDDYYRVDAEQCESCTSLRAISLRRIKVTFDKDGDRSEAAETLFEDVLVSPEFFNRIVPTSTG